VNECLFNMLELRSLVLTFGANVETILLQVIASTDIVHLNLKGDNLLFFRSKMRLQILILKMF